MPKNDWAFDFGVGTTSGVSPQGAGVSEESAVGLSDRIELGFRTAVRFDSSAELSTGPDNLQPDYYGRLFDRQTFDQGGAAIANPEVRFRWAAVQGDVAEVALEGRLVLPLSKGSTVGLLFGVPMAFHVGDVVRLDVGAFTPLVFDRQNGVIDLQVHVDLWIQATTRFWLGPMSGLGITGLGKPGATTRPSLGFGLGYEVTRRLDFKAMLLAPEIDVQTFPDHTSYGGGVGLEVRVE